MIHMPITGGSQWHSTAALGCEGLASAMQTMEILVETLVDGDCCGLYAPTMGSYVEDECLRRIFTIFAMKSGDEF